MLGKEKTKLNVTGIEYTIWRVEGLGWKVRQGLDHVGPHRLCCSLCSKSTLLCPALWYRAPLSATVRLCQEARIQGDWKAGAGMRDWLMLVCLLFLSGSPK